MAAGPASAGGGAGGPFTWVGALPDEAAAGGGGRLVPVEALDLGSGRAGGGAGVLGAAVGRFGGVVGRLGGAVGRLGAADGRLGTDVGGFGGVVGRLGGGGAADPPEEGFFLLDAPGAPGLGGGAGRGGGGGGAAPLGPAFRVGVPDPSATSSRKSVTSPSSLDFEEAPGGGGGGGRLAMAARAGQGWRNTGPARARGARRPRLATDISFAGP